jgi:hypothetical protein
MMLTFSQYKPNSTGINKYFEYDIPIGQWIILMLHVLMSAVNYCFRKDKKIIKQNPANEGEQKEYKSTAHYYEEKCDQVLRKKFPTISKYLNRIIQIFSNMMILIILIF